MIQYSDFHLSDLEIEKLKQSNARLAISEYVKLHGHAPSDISSFYTCTAKDIERRRRAWYAHYLTITHLSHDIESESNENGQQEQDFIISPQFNINWVFTNRLQDTYNGWVPDITDLSQANLVFESDNGTSITITDLSKSYDIPNGQYRIKGWIGRPYFELYGDNNRGKCAHKTGFFTVSNLENINYENQITLTLHFKDTLIISDKPFDYSYRIYTTNETFHSYESHGVYYLCVRNGCRYKGAYFDYDYLSANNKKLSCNSTTIDIEEFQVGARLFYNFENN